MPLQKFCGACSSAALEAWKTASELASAYNIGRAESNAAFNLLRSCSDDVVRTLASCVQCFRCRYFDVDLYASMSSRL